MHLRALARKIMIPISGALIFLTTAAAVIFPFDNWIWGTVPDPEQHSAVPIVIHHADGDTTELTMDGVSVTAADVEDTLESVCPTCGNTAAAGDDLDDWSPGASSLPESDPVHFHINEATQ